MKLFKVLCTYLVVVESIGSVAECHRNKLHQWLQRLVFRCCVDIHFSKDCTCMFCNFNFQFAFYSDIQKREISTRGIWGTLYDREASECRCQNLSIHISFTSSFILFLLNHYINFIYYGRVHIQGQLEEWRGEAPLADQRMITTVVDTNMMEGHAFFRMEGAHEITTKISGVTMVKMCISLLNAELVHPQEEWEHTFYCKKKKNVCVTLIIVLWVQALIQQKIVLVFKATLTFIN